MSPLPDQAAAHPMFGYSATVNSFRRLTYSGRISPYWPAEMVTLSATPYIRESRPGHHLSASLLERKEPPDGNWHQAYGVDTDGAVIVQPDGYVAWRKRSGISGPREVLRAVFDQLLGNIRHRVSQ